MNEEMMSILIKVIVILFGAVWSIYLLPWLKSKMSESQMKILTEFITSAVRSANQIYTPEEWANKKTYVLGLVKNFCSEQINITVTDEQLDALIEGMVNSVKQN